MLHNDSIPRGVTRVTNPSVSTRRLVARALVALLTAATLAACADESPVEPTAKIPEGGVKTALLGINIFPVGQQFPAKVAFVTGSPNGKAAYVQVYDRYGIQMARFKAFTDAWDIGGVEVSVGDVNGDGWPDIIAGEGPTPFSPNGSRFGVWDGKTGVWIGGFSNSTTYKGGFRVGAGDIDGDKRDEIFLCRGPSSEPTTATIYRVNPPNIFGQVSPSTGLGWFTGQHTYNGCRVAGGDVTGDGKDEMVVIFEGPRNTLWIHQHTGMNPIYAKPLGTDYTQTISVAVADRNGDGKAEVFLGRMAALDKLPPVRIFNGASLMYSTLPMPSITYPITSSIYNTGIHIAARDLSGDGSTELLAKLTTTGGYSMYVARMGSTFTSLWLNRFETPGTLPGGGPIG